MHKTYANDGSDGRTSTYLARFIALLISVP